ncbi:MAG: hypothetical protein A2583_15000 [Bdellovibrionales bacterium RIFOXYD1_FULL_53_11]|nr:MAG: hypothetical protein A2583_15000 [Bdellovibrionales bacterium RIFOXYD1_FULL_53_11]
MAILLALSAPALCADNPVTPCSNLQREILENRPAPARIEDVDVDTEPFSLAYKERNGITYYYGSRVQYYDHLQLAKDKNLIKLPGGIFVTGRKYDECVSRLGMTESEVLASRGQRWLSVAEGKSDFISESVKRGVDGYSVDVAVREGTTPGRHALAYAQKLPYKNEIFDKTLSIWLIPHFFKNSTGFNMFNPKAGRQAIVEMIRVTKIGGEVRINPVTPYSTPVVHFLEKLKHLGFIKYEIIPAAEIHHTSSGFFTIKKLSNNPGSYFKITRLK